MIEGWENKKLEEVCQFSNGLWKGEKPPFVNVGVIRNTNFTKDGGLDDSDIAYLEVEVKKYKNRRLQFGDIILEKSGGGPKQPVGRVAFFDKDEGDYSFSNFTAALRVRDTHKLDCHFLHKFLYWTYVSGVTEGMQSHSTGIRNLDSDAYKAIQICYPPLIEQHRIVRILDQAFERIAIAKANTEKNLLNAREVFESYLDMVFSNPGKNWEKCTLEKFVKFIDYRGHTPVKTKSGMRLITAKNVKNGFLQREPEEFVDPKIYNKWMVRGIPKKGDVLFTTEAPLANIAQLDIDEKVLFAQRIIIFQPQEEKIDQTFLKYLLLSRPIKARIINKGTGATVLGIKASLLKQVEIYFPNTLSDQRKFVGKFDAILEEIKYLESLYRRKLIVLEELKKSLLHQAFNGKL